MTDVGTSVAIGVIGLGVITLGFAVGPPARSAPVVSGFPVPEALISIEAIAVRKSGS